MGPNVEMEQPHHDGATLFVPDDAPSVGDTVPVFIRVPHADGATRAWIRTITDAEPHLVAGTVDRSTDNETWWRFDVTMRNTRASYRFLLDGGPRGFRWLNGTGLHGYHITDADDFKLAAAPAPPAWARDAVVYQIFPDRFARSAAADTRPVPRWARPAQWDDAVVYRGPETPTQLYGGDLDGIVEHLDHIAELGANTLYLTPFFPGHSNHRYNATSFDEVDSLLGGNEALARLGQAVHARGWRLLGDLTTNHCGDTHAWFQTARRDTASAEREFFYFPGPQDDAYESWLGFTTLPKFRYGSAELWRRMLDGPRSVAGTWLREPYDLDGWRIDVANMTGRHATDDFNLDVARSLRTTLAEIDPNALLLAEHCHDASADLAGDGWHGTMNYAGFTQPVRSWLRDPEPFEPPLAQPVDLPRLGADALQRAVRAHLAAVPWRSAAVSWALLSSHDSARIRTVVRNRLLVEVAAGLLFTMPSAPMVFAGDEIGLEGVLGEDARRPFPWQAPERWDRTTFDGYAALARLRTAHSALRRGGLRWVHADGDGLAFLRESPDERLLVHAARASHSPVHVAAYGLGLDDEAVNVYGGAASLKRRNGVGGVDIVTLPGDGPTFQAWQLR